jgi:hypothetical protein
LIQPIFTANKNFKSFGVIELRVSPRIWPPQLNVNSEETVLKGIARKSRAIVDNAGYLSAFVFHHLKISNFHLS